MCKVDIHCTSLLIFTSKARSEKDKIKPRRYDVLNGTSKQFIRKNKVSPKQVLEA